MAYSDIDQYKDKIKKAFNVATENKWEYLPLYDEINFIIQSKFDINYIAN